MDDSKESTVTANGTPQPPDAAAIERIVTAALDEDLGPDRIDVTSHAIFEPSTTATADIVARADGVIAGLPVARAVLANLHPDQPGWTFDVLVAEGATVKAGDVLATISGSVRYLLMAERTMLNLLSRASGVATHTRRFVDLLDGTSTTILDTRKTMPGLRALDKYAVRAGGGDNKRMGLYDVAMIKDNHKFAAGSIAAAYKAVRETFPDVAIQVEADTPAEAREAVDAGADFLLLDNMSIADLSSVVSDVGNRAELEATGTITLSTARAVAETGVDYISAGALTHSSPILDIALDIRVDRAA